MVILSRQATDQHPLGRRLRRDAEDLRRPAQDNREEAMVRRWAFVLLAVLAACDSGRLSAPRGSVTTGTTGTIGGSAASTAIVGTWRRVLYFFADDGSASSNETTWRFNSDGTASRLTVTRNFTAGLFDAQTVDARWEALTQSVRITYLPPSSGTFEFAYRITNDTLYLASQGYGRVR
jgi:hypothetical protein